MKTNYKIMIAFLLATVMLIGGCANSKDNTTAAPTAQDQQNETTLAGANSAESETTAAANESADKQTADADADAGQTVAATTAQTTASAAATTAQSEATAAAANNNSTGFDVNAASELKITMLSKIGTGSKQPTEDLLTPIWRQKTKVIPEIVQLPGDIGGPQYFQMQMIGGTMPEIIGVSNGIFDNPEAYNALRDLELLRPFTLDEIKAYMPLTVDRLAKWGVSVDDWYKANLDAATQQLWYIPSAPSKEATTLVNEPYVQLNNGWSPYSWYFRDDILKTIFPGAKTERELIDLYISKGGNLTFEDIDDVPIRNLDDFYEYLKKVKELDIKVGTNSVTPGQIQMYEGLDSMMWSAFTLPGFYWQDLGDRLYDVDENKFAYFADTPEWKNYVQWFNKLYNEDLIGKETFIQTEEQRDAKAANGEYAVFQSWIGAVNEARQLSRDQGRGYGFRQIFLFMPDSLKNAYQDNSVRVANLQNSWGAVGVTTSAKEADIPQILNWIDWNYSEEANELRAWGPPDFYTGDGYDRRFKDEYNEVARWAVSDSPGAKDGVYYGMYRVYGSDVDWNSETYGIGFDSFMYDYPPREVYPPDLSDPDNINIGWETEKVIKRHYEAFNRYFLEKPLGEDVIQARIKFDELETRFADIKATTSFDADGAQTQTLAAIIGPPEDFERNYQEYEDRYLTPEFKQIVKEMGEAWLAYRTLYMEKYTEPLRK